MVKGKPVSESQTEMAVRMMPQQANPAGNIHGGEILRYIDLAAATAAMRHARSSVVTASIDRMDFRKPAHVGELVTFKASLNSVGHTSMEVGVRVEAENLYTGEKRHTASAYLTFIAMDDGKPTQVPHLVLENPTQIRRNEEAKLRRQMRKGERERENISQAGVG
ncbi:MAG: acyl-CoA thioesterase [Desulfovibrio sp.]|uniref:acyl-CoA thioesterase n=1 Tax=Desulfovibrio sp. 7SRBS1 TaxID=3378064 RepID=UPI003B3CB9B0